jgi:hypothetical protein
MIWRLFKSGFNTSPRGAAASSRHAHKKAHDKPHLVEKGFHLGRPVRIYSDGSLKAITREGWIWFSDFAELARHFDNRRLSHIRIGHTGADPKR